jgi:alkylation response protein AidB-like acyl-CoA dehydrogenase
MAERGWLSLGWPVAAGGAGKPLTYEYILWDEVGYARAARPPLASGIVAKTIARYGDAAQRERWLPPIQRGEAHFSLAYSEPEAGSDLASARCRAELSGGEYVVSGRSAGSRTRRTWTTSGRSCARAPRRAARAA